MRKYILLFFIGTFALSCEKEDYLVGSPEYRKNHLEYIENRKLQLDCPEGDSETYFRAVIDGKEVCFKDGVNNVRVRAAIFNSFTTTSPDSEAEQIGTPKKSLGVYSWNEKRTEIGDVYFKFSFPKVTLDTDLEQYLDSLFEVTKHEFWYVPNVRNKGVLFWENSKFLLELQVVCGLVTSTCIGCGPDYDDNPGRTPCVLYSQYGFQEGNFIEIKDVKKSISGANIKYDVQMSFNCNLYPHIQWSDMGFWGKVEDAEMQFSFLIPIE